MMKFKDKDNEFIAVLAVTFLLLFILFYQVIDFTQVERIGAFCNDGSYSYATGSGTCSHHGGVAKWDTVKSEKEIPTFARIIFSALASYLLVFPVMGILVDPLIKRLKNKE